MTGAHYFGGKLNFRRHPSKPLKNASFNKKKSINTRKYFSEWSPDQNFTIFLVKIIAKYSFLIATFCNEFFFFFFFWGGGGGGGGGVEDERVMLAIDKSMHDNCL